ncbi:MAG: maleate isomerase [Parasphingorhabdus sp.]|jgi:maleate isomerase
MPSSQITPISVPDNYGSRGRARIGIVVPFSNTNLEPDMVLLRPDGVSLHFARAAGYDLNKVPDSDQMRKFALSTLDTVIDSLAAAKPDVILYGCTSATLAHGLEFDAEFSKMILARAGVKAVTAAGALVEALTSRLITKIGFCSPYVEQLNQEAIGFLSQCGIETVSSAYVGSDLGNYGQGELSPQQVFELGVRADSDQAEAVVLSCTDMRSVEIMHRLSEHIGKPIITSNQALMESALKIIEYDSKMTEAVST